MPLQQEQYMKEALALAWEAAEAGEVPVGCVIVQDGEIVGRAETAGKRSRQHRPTRRGRPLPGLMRPWALGGWRTVSCM